MEEHFRRGQPCIWATMAVIQGFCKTRSSNICRIGVVAFKGQERIICVREAACDKPIYCNGLKWHMIRRYDQHQFCNMHGIVRGRPQVIDLYLELCIFPLLPEYVLR